MIYVEPRYWDAGMFRRRFLELSLLDFVILNSRVRIAPRGYVFFENFPGEWVWEADP